MSTFIDYYVVLMSISIIASLFAMFGMMNDSNNRYPIYILLPTLVIWLVGMFGLGIK